MEALTLSDGLSGSIAPTPQSIAVINSLPLDLLALIFQYLDLTPRFLVISRVCRRWRIAVMKSVDFLQYSANRLPDVLAILPALTQLDVQFTQACTVALPMTLLKLTLYLETDITVTFLPPLPRLRHLCFSIWDAPRAEFCLKLLQECSSSLTALYLGVDEDAEGNTMPLRSMHVPDLVNLTFRIDHLVDEQTTGDFCAFLSRHASQLTSLSVSGLGGPAHEPHPAFNTIATFGFPRLRRLDLKYPDLTAAIAKRVITNAPSLANLLLSALDLDLLTALPPAKLSTLVELRFDNDVPVDFNGTGLLTRLTRLCRFEYALPSVADLTMLATTPAFAKTITFLQVHPEDITGDKLWPLLPAFANLTSLYLGSTVPLTGIDPIHLPKLTFLSLSISNLPVLEAIKVVEVFAATCPLGTITMHLLPFRLEHSDRLRSFVAALRERFVESLILRVHSLDFKTIADIVKPMSDPWMDVIVRKARRRL